MAYIRKALLPLNQTLMISAVLNRSSISRIRNPSYKYYLSTSYRFSTVDESISIDLSDEERKRRLFNRLMYRSKQRGFLELDLVLGKWVEEHIHSLDEMRIKALIDVLDLENPDLWKWLTSQEQPPEAVNSNPVFCAVREKIMGNLIKFSSPDTRAVPGQPWVRGWDGKSGQGGPVYGNQ